MAPPQHHHHRTPPLYEDNFYGARPNPSPPHQLQVTVISAQDLHPASPSMRAYAVSYLVPSVRHRTEADTGGNTEPYWNNTVAFWADDAALRSDTSALTVDLFVARPRFVPGSDTHIGIARIVLSSLGLTVGGAPRFVAIQVRRPRSLRPQGILNLSIALLKHNSSPAPVVMPARKQRREAAEDPEAEEIELKLEKWREELPPWSGAFATGGGGGGSGGGGRGERGKNVAVGEDEEDGTRQRRREATQVAVAKPPTPKRGLGRFACFTGASAEFGEMPRAPPSRVPPPRPRYIVERM